MAAGRNVRWFGACTDIEDQKQADDDLRESEERFRTAFDHAAVGMWMIGPDGRVLRANRAFCDTVGRTEAELLATDFEAITHPDDLAADLALQGRLVAGEIPAFHLG